MAVKEIALDQEIAELEGELNTRKRVYLKWRAGPNPKFRPDLTKHRIACLVSTIARLQKIRSQIKGEQINLFQ